MHPEFTHSPLLYTKAVEFQRDFFKTYKNAIIQPCQLDYASLHSKKPPDSGGTLFYAYNSTFSPANILLVVLMAHILPHMEQLCFSAGGMLSKYVFAFSPSMA